MENDSTKNNAGHEIDLWEILQKFGLWIGGILRAVFLFLLKKSVWLACFVIAGAAIGICLFVTNKPYYSTHMLVRANVVDNFYYVNLINEELSSENISSSLEWVRKLTIPASIAKQIASIRACYGVDINKDGLPDIIDEDNKYISSPDSSVAAQILQGSFYITVKTYSHDVLPHIRQNLLNFICKSEYVQQHNAWRIESIKGEIDYFNQQLNRFDSLQRYEYFQKENTRRTAIGGSQLLLLSDTPQPLYHDELIKLNNQIAERHTILQLYSDPITIKQEFAETSRQKNSLMFYVKPLILYAFLIGLVLAIIWNYRKQILKLYRS
jgi:hypothetical protein